MTSSNYARQVFRGNAAIVQKQATQFELYGQGKEFIIWANMVRENESKIYL